MRAPLAGLAVAVAVATTAAAAEAPEAVRLSYVLGNDGRGVLIANPVPDGSWGSMSWQACGATGSCAAARPTPDSDRVLEVGDAAAGTTFVATASDGTQSLSATSTPYRGRVHAERPPAVKGVLRVGHVITPVAAGWEGGWGGEKDVLQLQACRTKRDATCKVIADDAVLNACPNTSARIKRRYVGWYIRVADQVVGRDTVFAQRAYDQPEDVKPLRAGPAVAVATVGRVHPGRGAYRRC